ncbi:MAG: gluconate 2-dehydrogenase subunit 3 family protein [Gemmatimonadaceae bacterium]
MMSSSATDQPGIDRREAIRRVSALLGGAALIGGTAVIEACQTDRKAAAASKPAGTFTTDDVAFLDEVADTILPTTKTPGAKAAQVGAFMALMVTDCYEEKDQKIFRDGMKQLDAACQTANKTSFMKAASSSWRSRKRSTKSRDLSGQQERRSQSLLPHDEGAHAAGLLHVGRSGYFKPCGIVSRPAAESVRAVSEGETSWASPAPQVSRPRCTSRSNSRRASRTGVRRAPPLRPRTSSAHDFLRLCCCDRRGSPGMRTAPAVRRLDHEQSVFRQMREEYSSSMPPKPPVAPPGEP